eukprot:1160602-Pelagomonas_calceolata.AAC.8
MFSCKICVRGELAQQTGQTEASSPRWLVCHCGLAKTSCNERLNRKQGAKPLTDRFHAFEGKEVHFPTLQLHATLTPTG